MRSLLVVALVFVSEVARADALPPEEPCPPGRTWVNSHTGGGCQLLAPKNCALGWRGQVGGTCAVDEAWGGQCREDYEVRPATLCIEEFPDRGSGRLYYDPPRVGRAVVGIVGGDVKCEGEKRRTEAGKICLRPGDEPTPFVGAGLDPDGPRKPGFFEAAKKNSCAAAGADAGVMLVALALLLRRSYRPKRMP